MEEKKEKEPYVSPPKTKEQIRKLRIDIILDVVIVIFAFWFWLVFIGMNI